MDKLRALACSVMHKINIFQFKVWKLQSLESRIAIAPIYSFAEKATSTTFKLKIAVFTTTVDV